MIFHGGKLPEEIVLKKLFEKNIFSKKSFGSSSTNQVVEDYINNILSNSYIKDPNEIISFLKEKLPDFKNFSLIIMNDKITIEDRIAILKKVYKQKDQPHFINFFEKNMTDLSVLDIFIEGTILQNNRVREKDAALIKLWKAIFVNANSSYNGSTFYNKLLKGKINNTKSFTEKYSKYIQDPRFCKKIYNECVGSLSTCVYSREQNWEKFVSFMSSHLTTDEKINIVKDIPELKSLGSSFPKYAYDAYIDKDTESLTKYIEVFLEWSVSTKADYFYNFIMNENIDFTKLRSMLPEGIFDSFASKYCYTLPLSTKSKSYGLPGKMSNKNYIRHMLLNNSSCKNIKAFDDSCIKTLGISVESFKKSSYHERYGGKMYFGNMFISAAEVYKSIKEEANERIKNGITENDFIFAESMYNRFFKYFENSSESENLVNYIILVSNESDLPEVEIPTTDSDINRFYYYSTRTANHSTGEVYLNLLAEATSAGERCYHILCAKDSSYNDKKDKFVSNMNDAKNSIELICCFQDI